MFLGQPGVAELSSRLIRCWYEGREALIGVKGEAEHQIKRTVDKGDRGTGSGYEGAELWTPELPEAKPPLNDMKLQRSVGRTQNVVRETLASRGGLHQRHELGSTTKRPALKISQALSTVRICPHLVQERRIAIALIHAVVRRDVC